MTVSPEHKAPPAPLPDRPAAARAHRLWQGQGMPASVALGLLAMTVLAFYFQLWWPDRILIKRDASMVFLPIKQYLADRLLSGELPQWFPYDSMGRSFIGVAVTGVFHPFTLLYYAFPAPDALRASVLLSCLLASGGAFGLGRHLGLSTAGALLAGFVFACSGYVVSMTENIQYLYSICLLPLFLLTLERALSGGRKWAVASAVLWATVFLNGDIQTGYYFAFIALLWTGMRAHSATQALLTPVAIGGLAALLAGIQLGPSLAVYLDSSIRHPPDFQQFPLHWSTHPLRLLTMAAWPVSTESDPSNVMDIFFGGPATTPWAESLYLGMPVLVLAGLGAARRRDLRVFVVLGLLALLLALGRYGGLYEIFRHTIPLWSAFRYPEKWMGVMSFAVALLAGAGLDTLKADRNSPGPWLLAACGCMGVSLLLSTATAHTLLAVLHETSMRVARDVADTSARAWFISGVAAGGIGLLLFARGKQLVQTPALVSCAIVIIVLDLTAANTRAYFTAPLVSAKFTPPFVRALTAQEGTLAPGRFRVATLHFGGRIFWPPIVEAGLGYHGAQAVHYRQALNGGLNTEFGVEGFITALPGASPALKTVTHLQTSELYARMNVAYFVDIRSFVADQRLLDGLVHELPEYNLILARNPAPVTPRVYLSRHPAAASSPPTPEALFTRPDFLRGEVDVIETSDPLPGPAASGEARIEHYGPERVVIRTASPAPAVLVLVDAFDPGWRAAIETGEALPISRANLLMRAVVVPAGNHAVTFSYRTPFLAAGAAVTAAGILLALVLMGMGAMRGRPGCDAAAPTDRPDTR